MRSRFRCVLPVVLGLVLGVVTAARAEHVTLPTPPDWAVTKLDAPAMDGHAVEGTRHRAVLTGPGGRILAAIELVELLQTRDRSGQLPLMMQEALDQARADFGAHQLDEACAPTRPLHVAGVDGLRADCTVRRGGQAVLRQAIVMFVTAAGLYSVSYSAPGAAYEENDPVFEQALAEASIQ